jgi:hypothetical protein
MRADDLRCGIALQLFRSRVPAGDVTVSIEHEYRIVPYAFDERAKSLFAVLDLLFVFASLRKISRHLGKTKQFASIAAERSNYDIGPKQGAVFSNPPGLVFEAAMRGSLLEFVFRPPLFDSIVRVEPRKKRTDDLSRCISLDERCTFVPGTHMAS